MTTTLAEIRQPDGSLPAYAWPGGYQMYYVMDDGEALCPECANNNAEVHEGGEADGWRIDGYDVNYEDTELSCAHCGREIPASYAE